MSLEINNKPSFKEYSKNNWESFGTFKIRALGLNSTGGIEKSISIEYISCEKKLFLLVLRFKIKTRNLNPKYVNDAVLNIFRGDTGKGDPLSTENHTQIVQLPQTGEKIIEIQTSNIYGNTPYEQKKYYRATIGIKDEAWALSEGFKIQFKENSQNGNCSQNFEKIVNIVLEHEGGYSDSKIDKGGKTKYGIAWRTWLAYAKIDLGLEPTADNLKNLTKDQAKIIYLKRYWEPRGFCNIKNLKTALMIYDWTITSGGAVTEIQKLLVNELNQDLNINGSMDNNMIDILNNYSNQAELYDKITQIRKNYYEFLSYKTNPDGTFKLDSNGNKIKTSNYGNLKGWLNRVDDCRKIKL